MKSFGRLHLHLFAPYGKTCVFPLALVDVVWYTRGVIWIVKPRSGSCPNNPPPQAVCTILEPTKILRVCVTINWTWYPGAACSFRNLSISDPPRIRLAAWQGIPDSRIPRPVSWRATPDSRPRPPALLKIGCKFTPKASFVTNNKCLIWNPGSD